MQLQKNTPVMFTPVDAAKILNVSRSQVYVLLKDGALRSVKIGRSRRISENQLKAFIQYVEESDFTDV